MTSYKGSPAALPPPGPSKYSLVTPGETFRVLASAATLRKHLSDSYWCDAMEEVCDGKLEGMFVRYTGQDLVMMQFRRPNVSPAGYRYPLSMSLPTQYLVPSAAPRRALGASLSASGALPDGSMASSVQGVPHDPQSANFDLGGSSLAVNFPLCVVCGRYDLPGEMRQSGYKCNGCVGTKSTARLRGESFRIAHSTSTTET